MCSSSLRLQPGGGIGAPHNYYVLEEDCHYSITWPSEYGCPVSGVGSGAASGFLCSARCRMCLALRMQGVGYL